MKKITIIFLILTSFVQSQKLINPIKPSQQDLNDSLFIINDSLSVKKNEAKKIILNSIKSNESLNKELLFFKVKEDYYATALSNQADYFIFVITIILTLISLFSLGGFYYKINQLKKEYEITSNKNKKIIKKAKRNFNKMKYEYYSTRGNLNIIISRMFQKELRYDNAFLYTLLAAKTRVLNKKQINKNHTAAVSNLKSALSLLGKISSVDEKNNLLDQKKNIYKALKKISTSKVNEVISLGANVTVEFNNIISVIDKKT
jgi:hypothetical protein